MVQNVWRYVSGTIQFFLVDFGITQLIAVFRAPKGSTLEVRLPAIGHALTIRPTKADVLVLWQTFGLRQCRLMHIPLPGLILDAGANIGCTALFFAQAFPQAKIIAVDPDKNNVALARKNCRPYQNITIIEGAVWHQPRMLEIENPEGESWAFRMRERHTDDSHKANFNTENSSDIRGFTIDELSNGADIDVLKIDIEGGEKQLFQEHTHWLERVRTMLVELHGQECKQAVIQAAVQAGFRSLPPQGEYVVYTR